MAELIDGRLAFLKAELKITEAQTPAWNTLADAIRKSIATRTERMRGKWSEYFVGARSVPAMPTLHPAYLLRRPIDKKLAWRDLQAIAAKARELKIL